MECEEISIMCHTNPDAIIALIEQQKDRIAQLESRIAELEARLNQNSWNSNRPPSMDVYMRSMNQWKKGERSVGGQKSHKGQTLDWVKIPDRVNVHSVSLCEECEETQENGASTQVERQQGHDIPPLKIIVTKHHAKHKKCPHCSQYNRAEFPPHMQYPLQYGQKRSNHLHDLLIDLNEGVTAVQDNTVSLSHLQIADFKRRYSQIIKAGMRENPVPDLSEQPLKRGRKKQSKAKNLLDHCQKYQRESLLFMHDFSAPFSNNQAELEIRMVKLQQKIFKTFRSEHGDSWFCRVRGYISTVKKNEQLVLVSLVGIFEGNSFLPRTLTGQPEQVTVKD